MTQSHRFGCCQSSEAGKFGQVSFFLLVVPLFYAVEVVEGTPPHVQWHALPQRAKSRLSQSRASLV
jgi:hypothetical protein